MERCDTCQNVEGLFDSHWASGELKKFQSDFLCASFYLKIQQTMKIQEIPWKSKVLRAPLIFLKFLESAWFDFLVKAWRYWQLEYTRISMKSLADS